MKAERVYCINESRPATETRRKHGAVLYWMSREQRVYDNHGLIFAGNLAKEKGLGLYVVFCLTDSFLGATLRQYDFMLKGLEQVGEKLKERNIPFIIKIGEPDISVCDFIREIDAGYCVTDFDPIRIKREWIQRLVRKIDIPLFEVDGHNIVPARFASHKQEFGAYTLRPKINRHLDYFLDDFPEEFTIRNSNSINCSFDFKSDNFIPKLKIERSITPVKGFLSGEKAAIIKLNDFLDSGIFSYRDKRNDPLSDSSSNLSPYLHFGQISAQRIVLEVRRRKLPENVVSSFLEELIIRKELADNYCFHNLNYDNFAGFPEWAKSSLNEHRTDRRNYVYTCDEFENYKTHDDLWNAAQKEMILTGKMHGYLRMYWAKKILEWTESPEDAMRIAIYLNDKYELDGRDPNGYAGIAWSVGGVHDRAWFKREVFGKIRYMNYNGCKNKFDVKAYIKKFSDTNNKD